MARFYYSEGQFHLTCNRELQPGEFLRGALLSRTFSERVYFVMVPQSDTQPEADCWWPRVVGDK